MSRTDPGLDPSRGSVASRVLVVRSGNENLDTFEILEQLEQVDVVIEDDIYEAVATVGLAGPDEAVGTVLVPVTIPEYSAARVVEAFATVDSRVRLVLLVPSGRVDAMETALDAGFDDAIELPTTPRRLRLAIGIESNPLAPRRTVELESPLGRPGGFEREDASRSPMPASDATRRPGESPAPPPARPPAGYAPEPPPESPSGPPDEELPTIERAERLGDVDLVLSILDNDGSLRGTSLAMIRAHLGTGDVHLLLPDESFEGDRRTIARIHLDEHHVGSLASTTVGLDDLRRWADWLGTWMDLERRMRHLEHLTETDELTSAGNRRAFERILSETLETARNERRLISLMVFDIDNFKTYNDLYGHEAGDEVLRQTVDLLRCTIRRGDHVFRIGGDEFVVIFSDPGGPRNERSAPPESVEDIAHRFQAKVCELRFPQLGLHAEGSLSISAGLATFPWDGHDGPTLLRHADRLAMESKRNGKNAIRFGPDARDRCRPDDDATSDPDRP